MTKSDLIEALAVRGKLTVTRAEKIVNGVFSQMAGFMVKGEKIEIRGFGSFSIRKYDGYAGRNPKTGETIEVVPKRLPYFKVGKDLRERINGQTDVEQAGGDK